MWEKFTKQYPLSKTLRFELKPVGETEGYLEDFKSDYLKHVVAQDSERAEYYKEVKEVIDDYHRAYIEEKLSTLANPETGELHITPTDFEDAFSYFQNLRDNSRDPEIRKAWDEMQAGLRRKLVKVFAGNSELFKKELITRDLPAWLKEKGLWEQHKEACRELQ
jgi:CRISPR-associated protein Cpf1